MAASTNMAACPPFSTSYPDRASSSLPPHRLLLASQSTSRPASSMAGLPPSWPWAGMMAAPPGLTGKIEYRYFTKDGGPPNQAKPPSGPQSSQSAYSPPPYCLLPPYQAPVSSQPAPVWIPPAAGFPGAMCFPNGAPTAAPGPGWFQPQPPPPGPSAPAPSHHFPGAVAHAAAQPPEPPVSGNRVKDRLVVLKDSGGTGYVAPKHNATFHLFNHNVLNKYRLNYSNQFYIPPEICEPFRVMSAPCSMKIEELIEQLDCVKDAPAFYPRHLIGIAEAFDCGNGWFQLGSRIHLEEGKDSMTIKDLWGENVGEAGETRPRYLIRLPGKCA